MAAEMLVRCGVHSLLLFDFDKVEMANMNRMFYRPDQIGKLKTEAAIESLSSINPSVIVKGYPLNITDVKQYKQFNLILEESLNTESNSSQEKVQLVLSCVDNYSARIAINKTSLELNIPWIESGVSETAMGGHIQLMIPGVTACYECAPPFVVASQGDESTIQRKDVCTASLPTTNSIVSGLLVQHALKFLLKFGKLTTFIGYQALSDFFTCYEMKPNPDCPVPKCIYLNKKHADTQRLQGNYLIIDDKIKDKNQRQENEWGIEIAKDSSSSVIQAKTLSSKTKQQEESILDDRLYQQDQKEKTKEQLLELNEKLKSLFNNSSTQI